MIKNIIFDMGNVLIKFDKKCFLEAVNVSPEDNALLEREVYVSVEWAMMDRGTLTEKEAAERMCARLPERLHEKVHQLVDEWDRPILPMSGMAELAGELKAKGYRLFLLSNASYRQHEYWSEIPGSEYFEDTLISADVKLVKPQPEIYLMALHKFNAKPEESVFIDDATNNVEGAVYCGMEGIVFHGDTDELKKKLNAIGVDC